MACGTSGDQSDLRMNNVPGDGDCRDSVVKNEKPSLRKIAWAVDATHDSIENPKDPIHGNTRSAEIRSI